MTSASDINDARDRASRALEVLEKSIMERTGAEAVQNLHKVLEHIDLNFTIYL
jgi:NAD(P)H-hydrate repair Nnr-like enzyme with NAD(P)H-hydrate epimerase domain